MVAHALPVAQPNPTRNFGRFQLRQLLGKSAGTMVWLAFDPRSSTELMLSLPRLQPAGPAELEHWQRDARASARLDHPNLAPIAEAGVQDHWPFVAVERSQGVLLGEWLGAHPNPAPADVVRILCDVLQGLAFAHDAGLAHRDLQFHSIVVNERAAASVMGLGVASEAVPSATNPARSAGHSSGTEGLRAQRSAATRDVLACGVLLHHALTGQPVLDQADAALAIDRMTPLGRELVRLPWTTPLPIPEALRAIANRCTSAQERLRYQSARTLLGALAGWLDAQSQDGGGPLALLLDRLRTVGHLPALPGLAARVARITSQEGQRTEQIAEDVLVDMALTFELLRTLNSAQVQGTQVQGNGPVLTLRRIISLIGVNGVRQAANALRRWPGPLAPEQATALQATFDQVRLAGHVAQALRPAGYDAQVTYLIAVLQNLGRLMLRYHFADEAVQMRDLMQPSPDAREAGSLPQPGLSETAAGFAVLGVDIESLGAAVGRQWGLGDDVLHMARRLPADAPVRKPDNDDEVLRLIASAANEVADAAQLTPPARQASAMVQVAQRYGRALGIHGRDVTDALHAARETLATGKAAAASTRSGLPDSPVDDAAADTAPGGLAGEPALGGVARDPSPGGMAGAR
jgi:eukaryotic-like serine/threonine-protein kinase